MLDYDALNEDSEILLDYMTFDEPSEAPEEALEADERLDARRDFPGKFLLKIKIHFNKD